MAVICVAKDEFGQEKEMYFKLVSAEVNNISSAFSYGVLRGFHSAAASDDGESKHLKEVTIKCKINVSSDPWPQFYAEFMSSYGGRES